MGLRDPRRWWGVEPLRLPEHPTRRFYDWLRGSPTGLVALALTVGAGAGTGAVVFRYLIFAFTRVFTGYQDYSNQGHVPNPLVPGLGIWFVILAPIVGGLIYGPLIDLFAREARGHGVPEVMLAVAERGGRIRPQVAVIKSVASALCIGCGGSVGREGPIVQIGSALGSTLGQIVRVPEARLRLLVACGAAGGISATFNAPIAGVFFGLELILRDFEIESFGVVVLASVLADVIGRMAFGAHPFLLLPQFKLVSPTEYLLYAGLGVLAAVVGVVFIRVLYGAEDLLDRVWHGPQWLRPGIGGILLGGLLFTLPQLYGVGYPALEGAIRGNDVVWLLLALLAGKIVATSLTIAIGGSGGVFAPSLFMGAMLGTAYGDVLHRFAPGLVGPAGAYGLVGMGAVFAGAAQAPITSVLIIFELTGDYQIILPLMFAIVLAAGLSNLMTHDTIYTLKLRRRGIDIRRGRAANLMEVLTVGEAMRPVPQALPAGMALNEVIARITQEGRDALPVVDARGTFRGTVTAHQVEQAMRDNALDAVAGDLAGETPTLAPGQTLEDALRLLVRHGSAGLPVLDPDGRRVIGWLTHRDVLRAYNARLEETVAQVDGRPRPAAAPAAAPASLAAPSPLAQLRGYRVVDLEIGRDAAPVGRRLTDMPWPPSSLVIAIRRNGVGFVPTGQTELQRGDRLSVLTPAEHADSLADLVGGTRAPRGRDEAAAGHVPTAPGPGRPQPVVWPPEDGAVLEPTVVPGSWLAGVTVRDLRLDEGVLLVAIHRGTAVLVPNGDTRLAVGDRCVVIVGRGRGGRVLDLFRAGARSAKRTDG